MGLDLSRAPILRRLIPSLRKRIARARSVGGFSLRRAGDLALLLNTGNYVDRQVAFGGDYEAAQQAWLFGRMAGRGCDLFVDVGANIGLYSLRVARRGLATRIVAFEPDPRNRLQLGANILLNRLAGRIEVRAEAVSDAPGSVTLALAADSSTGQTRVEEAGQGIAVPSVTLDQALPVAGLRVAIKMDIEGHEIAACRGLAGLAARNAVLLQVESFGDRLPALTGLLAGMGLAPIHAIGDDHWFSNEA